MQEFELKMQGGGGRNRRILRYKCHSERSEVSTRLGLESRFVWLLGAAYLSRASKFSFLLSSATQATSPCIAES